MKYLFLLFISLNLNAIDSTTLLVPKYSVNVVPQTMTKTEKKARFYFLVLPAVYKVYNELIAQYKAIKQDIEAKKANPKIQELKNIYHVQTDKELLLALKPHPKSITIAQAAMESAWGTSRFFREANNIFGIWSRNKNDKRIAANIKRDGKYTIWLRKFDSLDESVREYYKTMGRAKAYKEFRRYRYESDDVFKIIEGLGKYSEIGHLYIEQLSRLIKYNKLVIYDK